MSGQPGRDLQQVMGLQDAQTFFNTVDERIKAETLTSYCLVAVDIEHFRLFNKVYGRNEGDYLLEYIAKCIRTLIESCNGVAGYLGGDNFGLFIPNERTLVMELNDKITKGVKKISNTVGFLPAFGVAVVDSLEISAMNLYDKAAIALSQIFGNYTNRVCYYENSMTERLEEEIKLLSEIQDALDNDEFTFFAQPQCDISTGKIVGAESLVRWNHHSKGLIAPGVFIPVLEKNGSIAELDCYVWEKVCQCIRNWLDKGYHPVPISINVSRIDIFFMDVPKYLVQLIEKYNLQPKMLKVEITESAYAENDEKINSTVKELQEAGFLVMMDDFGSGYSSLNMLKNVAVDVLKIDMRFLEIGENDREKGMGILESVVNMSRQMGLPIIVEGVETKAQEDFLLGMGCRYTQGYYYYRPLPIVEFEKIISNEKNLDYDGLWCKQVEPIHVKEFLDTNLFNDTMLNNLLGATAFYDLFENRIEITRVNNQYYKLTGISSDADINSYTSKFWTHVPAEERSMLVSIFEQAYANPTNGASGYVHFIRTDDKVLWIHMKVFFLREREGHKLFYSSLSDVSFMQKEKETLDVMELQTEDFTEKEMRHLDQYYGDMPCGVAIGKVVLDENKVACDYELAYINREMEQLCNSDANRLKHLALIVFADKADMLVNLAYRAAYLGETTHHYAYSSLSSRYMQFTFYQFKPGYAGCILRDITYAQIREKALQGIMSSYKEIYFVHLQDNYYRMIYPNEDFALERGNYEEAVNRWFSSGKIVAYDENNVRQFLSIEGIKAALTRKDTVEYKYLCNYDGKIQWCMASICISERVDGEPKNVVMMIRNIDALIKEEERQRRQNMGEFLAHTSDGFFIYRAEGDEKILYANSQVLNIYGCRDIFEFRELVGNSFKGMVHPDDYDRVEREIHQQLRGSEKKEDYVEYRIIRKDGEVRWVTDCGHLDDSEEGNPLFYVFISDATEKMH